MRRNVFTNITSKIINDLFFWNIESFSLIYSLLVAFSKPLSSLFFLPNFKQNEGEKNLRVLITQRARRKWIRFHTGNVQNKSQRLGHLCTPNSLEMIKHNTKKLFIYVKNEK